MLSYRPHKREEVLILLRRLPGEIKDTFKDFLMDYQHLKLVHNSKRNVFQPGNLQVVWIIVYN